MAKLEMSDFFITLDNLYTFLDRTDERYLRTVDHNKVHDEISNSIANIQDILDIITNSGGSGGTISDGLATKIIETSNKLDSLDAYTKTNIDNLLKKVDELENRPSGGSGSTGAAGATGVRGPSAFEVWQSIPGNENKTLNDYMASIKGDTGPIGPIGPQGPKGDKGDTGDVGPKGDTGTSLTLQGRYETEEELRGNVTGGNIGDAYIIGEDLFVYDGNDFVNMGRFKGPMGDTGPTGATGPIGPTGIGITPRITVVTDLDDTKSLVNTKEYPANNYKFTFKLSEIRNQLLIKPINPIVKDLPTEELVEGLTVFSETYGGLCILKTFNIYYVAASTEDSNVLTVVANDKYELWEDGDENVTWPLPPDADPNEEPIKRYTKLQVVADDTNPIDLETQIRKADADIYGGNFSIGSYVKFVTEVNDDDKITLSDVNANVNADGSTFTIGDKVKRTGTMDWVKYDGTTIPTINIT